MQPTKSMYRHSRTMCRNENLRERENDIRDEKLGGILPAPIESHYANSKVENFER